MTSLTYQNIVNLIRATANAVNPTGTFVHARRSDGSLEYDGAMPQIHLYPFQVKGNQTKEADLIIGFWKQDSPESSNEQREAIISAMDVLQQQFVETLDNTQTIELANFIAEPNYRQLAGTLSGYIIKFTLRGALDCEDIPIPVTFCEQIEAATAQSIVDCLSPTKEDEVKELICEGGLCVGVDVRNSNDTFGVHVNDAQTLTLPNEAINIYVDGVLNQTGTYIPLSGQDINISA